MTPGGSSAGAAAAVASGVGPLALAVTAADSVGFPASFCGLFGFKPSFGRIPLYPGARDERYPGASGWESIECYGPLTRTVADAALMTSVMAGPDLRDRHSRAERRFRLARMRSRGDLKGKRIAYSRDWGYAAVDAEVCAIAIDARGLRARLGCIVERPTRAGGSCGGVRATCRRNRSPWGCAKWPQQYRRRMSSHLVDLLCVRGPPRISPMPISRARRSPTGWRAS